MSRPKVLSGQNVVRIFEQFGFAIFSQKGSHIKMRRVLEDDTRQTLTIPNHKELDRGTAASLFRQASAYIPQSELRPHFYND